MRRWCIFLTIYALLAIGTAAGQEQSVRVGVAEFEVKNDIGLDNAAVVIPEVLVSKLKDVGKYELSERILMEKVLEEQKLQMTGLTDEETVVKVGEIYNIAAVVSGSAMRVGSTITISGRLIGTETAEIRNGVKYDADGSFAVPDLLSGMMTIEYSFNDRFSLMLYYLSQAGEGPPKSDSKGDSKYMSSNYLSIAGGYSFSFDKR